MASVATRTNWSKPSTSWKLKSIARFMEDITSSCWECEDFELAALNAAIDFLEASIALFTSCACKRKIDIQDTTLLSALHLYYNFFQTFY